MSKKVRLEVGDQAPNGTAVSQDEESVELGSLWADGPTLLTFLRHFG